MPNTKKDNTPAIPLATIEFTTEGKLNPQEYATVLHGLRMIQCAGRIEGCAAGDCEHFDDHEALTNEQIDALAERINLGWINSTVDRMAAQPIPATVKVVVTCDGGLVQDVCANVPIEWAMIDYDTEGADEDRLTAIPQEDGSTTEAYAYTAHADVLPERVAQLLDAIRAVQS